MNHNQTVGKYGEDLAKNYLKKLGYKIIDSNVKISFKEIDIVALDGKILVFCEVKTRTSSIYGNADDALINKKINNMKKAAGMYLGRNKNNYEDIRLDFIAVDIDKLDKNANISHYKDIL